MLDIIRNNAKSVDVWSPDTDVLILLMDLVASRGQFTLHNFSGADWGGKFTGISTKTWIKSYLALDENDTIVKSFQKLGEVPIDNLLRLRHSYRIFNTENFYVFSL